MQNNKKYQRSCSKMTKQLDFLVVVETVSRCGTTAKHGPTGKLS